MIVVEQYWQPWADLVSTLETGAPAFDHVFGTDVWAWRNENFRGGDIFAAYVASETFAAAGPIVEALDLSGVGSIADIGGGHGGRPPRSFRRTPACEAYYSTCPRPLSAPKRFLTPMARSSA